MIPRAAHFVWLGRELSWVHLVALASAVRAGEFEHVTLHHTDPLDDSPVHRELAGLSTLKLERLDPEALLVRVGRGELVGTYRALAAPAARSNLIRAALLFERGGVYLDADTVTLRSFAALCARGGAFCGEERLVFPVRAGGGIAARFSPVALLRTAARDVLRRLPEGQRAFSRIERLYPTGANNAVLGAEPRHPFLTELFARMLELLPRERLVRYALGTHALQRAVASYRGGGLEVLPPAAFYPLGPEISEHWFRLRQHVHLDQVVSSETLLVHWYASVRTARHVRKLDASFVRRHADRQLFSALALPTVEALARGELSAQR